MKNIVIFIILMFILCSCSNFKQKEKNSENVIPNKDNILVSNEYSKKDFTTLADELGYTDYHLSVFFEENYSKEKIVNIDSFPVAFKQKTEDNTYNFSGFYMNDYRDSFLRICVYSENIQTNKKKIFSEIINDNNACGMLSGNRVFFFLPYINGKYSCNSFIKFYNLDDTKKPYATWNPMNDSTNGDYSFSCFDFYHDNTNELLYVSCVKYPVTSNIDNICEFCTYKIISVDYQGNSIREYDTGITVNESRYGGFAEIIFDNFDKESKTLTFISFGHNDGNGSYSMTHTIDLNTGIVNAEH